MRTGKINQSTSGILNAGVWQLVEEKEITISSMVELADILNEDMSDITDWTDQDASGGESSQAAFDSKSCMKLLSGGSLGGYAERIRDIGSFTARTIISGSFYFDAIGTQANIDYMELDADNGTTRLRIIFASDGLKIYDGASWHEVGTDLVVQDVWQKWTFDIHWTAQTVDIYLDDILKEAGVDCSVASGYPNGTIFMDVYGYATTNRLVYIDWLKISNGGITSHTFSNLNGDIDQEYRLVSRIIDNGGAGYYKITMNTDTSGGHYGLQRITGNNTTAGAYRNVGVDYIQLCNGVSIASGEHVLADFIFHAKSGYVRTGILSEAIGIATTTVTQIEKIGACWNNTADNITQIVLTAGAANGLGIGSHLLLFKRNLLGTEASSGIKTGDLNVQGSLNCGVMQKIRQINIVPPVANGILDNEDMSDITDWTNEDTGFAESTQVTFDSKSCMKLDGGIVAAYAMRSKVGMNFTNKTAFSMNIYHAVIGASVEGPSPSDCFHFLAYNGTYCFDIIFQSDGLFTFDGVNPIAEVGTNLVALTTWQEWTFDVDWINATVDVYLNNVFQAQGTACLYSDNTLAGKIQFYQSSDTSNNQITYVDWIKISNSDDEFRLAQTSITIDGLDGNTDTIYELRTRIVNAYNGTAEFNLLTNNDSGSNYGYQCINAFNTDAGASRAASTKFYGGGGGYTNALNDLGMAKIVIYTKAGFVRTALCEHFTAAGTTCDALYAYGESWNNTVDNITSLVLTSNRASAFGIGTTIELWALRKKI